MNNQEIENAIVTLKKYHDLLHEVYADYAVYSKAENYSDKSLELASRANTVKNAVGTAITCMERQLTNGWIPVDSRLPKERGWYLVHAEGQRPYVAFFKGNTFPLNNHYHKIVAWQPLPEPYREDTP